MNHGRLLIRAIDPQLIGREVTIAFEDGGFAPQSLQHCTIETLARIEITHAQVNVIDQSPAMEFHVSSP